MGKSVDDVNAELLNEQKYWVDNVLGKYIKDRKSITYGSEGKRKDNKLSHPFYMGISQQFFNADKDKRIMIIGQEAGGYGTIDDGTAEYSFIEASAKSRTNAPENSQKWAIAYLQKQLYDRYDGLPDCYNEIKRNTSPFWEFFRKMNSHGFQLCWNNLDKVYFGKTLSYTAEKYLSAQYRHNGKKQSLLQREIGLADPYAVILVTGPYYDLSMEAAFDKNSGISKYRPTVDNLIVDITRIVNFNNGVRVYWTYHPMFLNCLSAIDKIADKFKMLL